MRRVAAASAVGTSIEFYDFFIYGTAAALVFGPLFFPALGAAAATVASFATFGVAFFFRPVGSILFGHFGDRLGRKKTLVSTLLLMGLSTFAIGLVPTADEIGVAAPLILVLLRVLQGLAVGGEWAGAALLTAEYAPPHKRGWYSLYPQLGPAVALGMSSLTFLITTLTMSPEAFAAWGWRLPFLVSLGLVAVGLFIRLKIEETPVFSKAVARLDHRTRLPFAEAVRHQWRQILLTGGTLTMALGGFYVGGVFLASYAGRAEGVGVLGLSRTTVLAGGIFAALVMIGVMAVAAYCSDRFGRRRILLIGTAGSIVLSPLAFMVMEPGDTIGYFLGLVLLFAPLSLPYGPGAAYLPELFQTRFRYTGAGMGYNLAGILGGALPLVIAPPLTKAHGGMGIGWYLAVLGLISTVCVLAIGETKHLSIDTEPAGPAA
jgi:MFS family permease